ncbi:ribonuclease HIII [Planctomycetota bacterium]|nr:ribonuclease HIII [Planctomycetota bacterium]
MLEQLGSGWVVAGQKTIPYGRQYELIDAAGGRGNLNCYNGKKGFKFVTGGKLADVLNETLGGPPAPEPEAPVTSGNPFGLSLPRIGADESGKGDFFGPLVVASFHLDAETEKALAGSGIVDSKKLTDPQILRLAGKLDQLDRGHVISLMPEEYNLAYAETRNLNVLLSKLHGRCIRELMQKLGAPKSVLVDQFSTRTNDLKKAIAAPAGTILFTRTKAEADLAVASASILARAAFLDGIKKLEADFGADFPTGAGSPVIKAGKTFKRSFGEDKLKQVAKTHFKTSDSL